VGGDVIDNFGRDLFQLHNEAQPLKGFKQYLNGAPIKP
jgi:hypothetical protein